MGLPGALAKRCKHTILFARGHNAIKVNKSSPLMQELLMPEQIFLTRHATPDWSRTDIRYDIPPGPPLTAQGESEARLLGDYFKEQQIVKAYVSPLSRTLQTAAIACEIAAAPFEIAAVVAEWQVGETETTVLERMLAFLDGVLRESDELGPIAIITHGGPIRLLLQHFGMDEAQLAFYRRQFDRDNPLPPAGVWSVTRTARSDTSGYSWTSDLVFTPRAYDRYQAQTVRV
jgi:broad specificity phosphatase PhoE